MARKGKFFLHKNIPTTMTKLFTVEPGVEIKDILIANIEADATPITLIWGTDDSSTLGTDSSSIVDLPNLVHIIPTTDIAAFTAQSIKGILTKLKTPIKFNQTLYIYGKRGGSEDLTDGIDITIIT